MSPRPNARPRVVVIGIGNEFRHDDGAAAAVLAALGEDAPGVPPLAGLADRLELSDGEPTRVIEAWRDADLAVVVDAVHAHPGEPGRLHEVRLHPATEDVRAVGNGWGNAAIGGSHALGLGEAAALGAALGRLPRELVVVGVEGADFGTGPGLSPVVAGAVPAAAARVRRIIAGYRAREAGSA